MPWKRAACGCLIAVLVAACQPDSPSITEVEGTLDHHPERPSCHFAPEAITTIDGEDEVVLIEFTYGGGETWSDPPGQCGEDPGPNLGGVLLAADGVSYGDSVGADGDFITLQACETVDPQLADCAYNMPSPRNSIRIDALLSYTGYLTFDPPISELSFRVCSSQSHALAAWDSIGNLVVPDTIGPSNGSIVGGDLYCDPEGWEEFDIQASGYDISRVRLRRFESCQIQTFTPRANDIAVIDSTFVADSIFDGGPNHGLFFVGSALFAMEHGSYYNLRSDPTRRGVR